MSSPSSRPFDPLRPVAIEPREGFRIWIRYADGVDGVADLSDLAGAGVFATWLDRSFFESVRIAEGGEIAWRDQIDLCRHALYLRITDRKPEEVLSGLRRAAVT